MFPLLSTGVTLTPESSPNVAVRVELRGRPNRLPESSALASRELALDVGVTVESGPVSAEASE